MRIHRVLMDRQQWLQSQMLPLDHLMSWEERGAFLKWIMEQFEKDPIEAPLIARARAEGRSQRQIKIVVRSHWSLEKQRRAGSSQVWELLSFTGKVTPDFLAEALEPKPNNSAPERVDEDRATDLAKRARKIKEDLRYGKMLQRREQKRPGLADALQGWVRRLLQEAKDGTLKRRVNTAVLEAGRGRLRGDNDDDYIDIGTNQDRSVVLRILDGTRPKPDTSRFEYE